jgi:hypothetical protein
MARAFAIAGTGLIVGLDTTTFDGGAWGGRYGLWITQNP